MRIGIITMHKVTNFGSALQAYALQKYIEDNISDDVCLIDYEYPNKEHKRFIRSNQTFLFRSLMLFVKLVGSILKNRKKRQARYDFFYDKYFRLTEKTFHSNDEICKNPPLFDVYVTGSDQVWNVNTMNNDGAFYLNFAPKGSFKISFGACYSTNSVPERFLSEIKSYLSSYSRLGLREASGVDFVKGLGLDSNIQIFNTCDPTLLLNKTTYDLIAKDSIINIEGDYILVYYLAYYNCEPALSLLIEQAKAKFKCKVIFIGYRFIPYKGSYQYLTAIGPVEFLWLYSHAKFIISCSFHGTIFSIINRKPFYTIVPSDKDDNRSKDLLQITKLHERAIVSSTRETLLNFDDPFTTEVLNAVDDYIQKSRDYLEFIKTFKEIKNI